MPPNTPIIRPDRDRSQGARQGAPRSSVEREKQARRVKDPAASAPCSQAARVRVRLEVREHFRYNHGFLKRGSCGVTQLESAAQVWRQAVSVLLLQAVLAALAAAIAVACWGLSAGIWALAGGAICVLPTAVFGYQLYRAAKRSGTAFAIAFLLGKLVKVLLVTALFALAYSRFGGANAAALLLGFVAAIQGYFLALLIT